MTKKNVIGFVLLAAIICAAVYAENDKDKNALSDKVKAAIQALYPAGTIKESKIEKKSVKLYEVKVDVNGVVVEVTAGADGTVAEVATKEKPESLPAAVSQAITDKGGKVIEAEKKVVSAQIKLVKLDAPVTKYEVTIEKDGQKTELQIADSGKILKEKKEDGDKK